MSLPNLSTGRNTRPEHQFMTNEPIAIETALLNLYIATRKANLPLDEHDMCRAYVDVLAQALNLKIDWVVPSKPTQDTPVTDAGDEATAPKKKKNNKK
jgi:hypothetical protein